MAINFIQKLYESEIQNTELALATESFSDEIQNIIEKVTNLKTKELSDLVKKIKYDGDIEKADQFNAELGQKLDTLIQTATEVKNEIDNNVVQLFQGDSLAGGQPDVEQNGLGDLQDDLGQGEDDFDEFNADEETGDEDISLDDLDFGEVERERK
ncbi:MAG: hypothetical protein J6X03_00755 [Bacilli bacterium]|nr:hypothetical protein [Bacilli bacterium]